MYGLDAVLDGTQIPSQVGLDSGIPSNISAEPDAGNPRKAAGQPFVRATLRATFLVRITVFSGYFPLAIARTRRNCAL